MEKGHCELALTLYLCDFNQLYSVKAKHRIPRKMVFPGSGGRKEAGGLSELALLGKVHISKHINFPNPVFANNVPLSLWAAAKDGMEVMRRKGGSYWPPICCLNSLLNPSSQTSHRVAKFFRNVKRNMKVGRSNRS